MTRLVFLDVDGTLIDHSQQVPPSAQQAVRAAVSAGHTLILCTGRVLPEIYPWLWELGFHGIVSGNGATIRVGEQTLLDRCLPSVDVQAVTDVLDQCGAHYLWQTSTTLHPSPGFIDAFAALADHQGGQWLAYLDYVRPVVRDCVPAEASKCTFTLPAATGHTLADVDRALHGRFTIIPGSVGSTAGVTGELVAAGVSKGEGVRLVARHLGVDVADVIAVGDSANDLPMFEVAGTALAMGNATPALKEAADWVSTPIHEDGLAHAFAHVGLTTA